MKGILLFNRVGGTLLFILKVPTSHTTNSGIPFGTGWLANALENFIFSSVFFYCLINFINYYASFVTLEFRSTLQNFLFLTDYLHSIIIYEIYSIAKSH